MKILHTADWHIGHSLNGWSREEEHRLWFRELADVIEEEEIDALLVAGDVYDGINPSGESQKLLYDALAAFKRRRPGLITVMTSGNHDPSLRLEAPEAILEGLDCFVAGTVGRNRADVCLDKHLIPLPGADGRPAAWVLAIPFLRASDLPGMTYSREEDHIPAVVRGADRFHQELVAAALRRTAGAPLIAMGHLHCMGATVTEDSERPILLGGEHALPASIFPPEIGYVALGHLHKPQELDGGRVRYSGSCFFMSASEAGYRHGVTILELKDGAFERRHREMARPTLFLRIPEKGQCDIGELEAALTELDLDPATPVELRPYVHVTLAANGPASVIRSEAERILATVPVRLAGIKILREQVNDAPHDPTLSLAEIRIEDLFRRAFVKVNGTDPEPRHIAAFNDIAGTI